MSLALLLLLAVPTAGGATRATDPPRIVPWHLIGNIALGMSHRRVERIYGRAVNGNPPRDTVFWSYRGRGTISVDYEGPYVEALDTTSPVYTTPGGIHVGTRSPFGARTWRGFTFDRSGGPGYEQWQRTQNLGGPVRANVQLFVDRRGTITEIWISRFRLCPRGQSAGVGLVCRPVPKPPYYPPPAGTRYCEKPDFPGDFLAASPAVTCSLARAVRRAVYEDCGAETHCLVFGFRCDSGSVSFRQASVATCWKGRLEVAYGIG